MSPANQASDENMLSINQQSEDNMPRTHRPTEASMVLGGIMPMVNNTNNLA
jgi:hypothetical protein